MGIVEATGRREAEGAGSASVQRREGGGTRGTILAGMSYAEGAAYYAPVQCSGGEGVLAAAQAGIAGSGGSLPHLDAIQMSFGRHDVGGVQAYTGSSASAACAAMGAQAYATGNSVAFSGAPSLHTAAHEAAHVVQQRAGVSLKGGVGQAGDVYERHADAVADLVVQGKSAEGLLDTMAGSGGGSGGRGLQQLALQFKGGQLTGNASFNTLELKKGDVIEYETRGMGMTITHLNGEALAEPVSIEFGASGFLKNVGPVEEREERREVGRLAPRQIASSSGASSSGPSQTPNGLRIGDLCVAKGAKSPAGGVWQIDAFLGSGELMRLRLVDPDAELAPIEIWYAKCVDPSEVRESAARGNKLIRDEDVRGEVEQRIRKTPSGLKGDIKGYTGKDVGDATYAGVKFSETANIEVDYDLNDTGVELRLQLWCNPDYMCETEEVVKDLCPIYFEFANDRYFDLISVVEPTLDGNHVQLSASYTWACLGTLLKLDGVEEMEGPEIWRALSLKHPTLGVKAQWLAANNGKNSPNHTMGGVLQKGGSGLIKLRELTLDDYAATEDDRNMEWNEGELLTRERPVFRRFPNLLKLGKELATTLEAESEFVCVEGEPALMGIVEDMRRLLGSKSLQRSCGILEMSGKPTPKIYEDTYYDVLGTKDGANDLALLRHGIVMRRRHVDGDKEGTFLFTIKGRAVWLDETEMIRLAAQCQMNEEAMAQLPAFLRDRDVDNPFARAFQDAIDKAGLDLSEETEPEMRVEPVMTVHSERYKFMMKLENSTAIDFSADIATGYVDEMTPESPKVCSFEFGVGHPGLTATATASVGRSSEPPPVEGRIHRPYHTPADLENRALFEKDDYQQYKALRTTVMDKVLGTGRMALDKGGNKASLLAQMLKMI